MLRPGDVYYPAHAYTTIEYILERGLGGSFMRVSKSTTAVYGATCRKILNLLLVYRRTSIPSSVLDAAKIHPSFAARPFIDPRHARYYRIESRPYPPTDIVNGTVL